MDSQVPQVGADRPQLVAVRDITIATPLDPYLTLRALAAYSGCSTRWLRERLTCLTHPLPHYRVNGKILVRPSEFDTWMAPFRQLGSPVREACGRGPGTSRSPGPAEGRVSCASRLTASRSVVGR